MTAAVTLQNFGNNNLTHGGCAFCGHALRKESLRCADLLCCDYCGVVWGQHGTEGLLREIGRREVK